LAYANEPKGATMNRSANEPEHVADQPDPAHHSDDERSRMPERADKSRKQSPADHPGQKPGEGEPSVG
jgi:hypothetical protein